MTEHTPTPWREWNAISETGNDEYPTPHLGDLRLVGANNICIGVTFGGYASLPECNANAAFIVKAVNSHGALVMALEDIRRATIEGRVCDDVAWFDQITTLHDFCDTVLASVGKAL